MASYTDILPKFNPYVQQMPVETMVTVGMQKQKQYEENVTKIQGQIDNIAGLDVANDVDKQYLQSKLNQLGNDLTSVAGGDFSNFQLVNSVSGMTGQIVKDKNVRNAVSSTAWLRKQQAEMEKAISEGKSSQANIYDFNQKASRYLSSQTVGDSFSGRYKQYTDIDKKWMDVFKTLHPSLKEEDIPFERDINGNIDYNKTAKSMQRISKETVSAAQIENALRSSLSPDDLEQLAINGKYEFRGATPEKLSAYYTGKYTKAVTSTDEQIKQLEGLVNLSASDPVTREKALSVIEELKLQKLQLNENLDKNLSLIATNPDLAKAEIYKNGAISQFANSYSWETNKLQRLTNPDLEAEHWEKTNQLARNTQALAIRAQNYHEWLSKKQLDNTDRDYALKLNESIAKVRGTVDGMVSYGGQSTLVKDPITSMKSDAVTSEQSANANIVLLAKQLKTTVAGAEEQLKEYNNGNKSKIPVNWRGVVEDINKDRLNAFNLNATVKQAEDQVNNSKESILKRNEIDRVVATKQPLTISVNGTSVSFSPKEVYNFLIKSKYRFTGVGEVGIDKKYLTDKEKVLYNASINNPFSIKGLFSKTSWNIADIQRHYSDVVNANKNYEEAVNAKVTEILLPKAGKYIPAQYNINVTNKDGATSRDNMEGIAGNILSSYGSVLGGIQGGAEKLSTADVKAAREWLNSKDKDNIQYKKLVQGNDVFLVMMKGAEEKVIPLTPQQAVQLPANQNEPSAREMSVRELQQMGNGNTNITSDPTKSHFQGSDFQNLRTVSASADLQWDQKNNALNYINLNIKLPSGWKNLQLDDYPTDILKATKRIQTLTDEQIKQIFLKDRNVAQSVKDEINNL